MHLSRWQMELVFEFRLSVRKFQAAGVYLWAHFALLQPVTLVIHLSEVAAIRSDLILKAKKQDLCPGLGLLCTDNGLA